jgi:predicted dithiol-disulfide oxidoreductase (DUF899 family)
MTEQRTATREEWQAARNALLAEEKELTRRNDELARKRRELPWVPVEKEYRFETVDGTKSLADLFDGRSQLLIYHFMFGPEYEAGCPVCSSIADTLDPNAVHLRARDVTLICSSRAPLEKLRGYKERMGWSFNWVSTVGSDFHRELGFARTKAGLLQTPLTDSNLDPLFTMRSDRQMVATHGIYTTNAFVIHLRAIPAGDFCAVWIPSTEWTTGGAAVYYALTATRIRGASRPMELRRLHIRDVCTRARRNARSG